MGKWANMSVSCGRRTRDTQCGHVCCMGTSRASECSFNCLNSESAVCNRSSKALMSCSTWRQGAGDHPARPVPRTDLTHRPHPPHTAHRHVPGSRGGYMSAEAFRCFPADPALIPTCRGQALMRAQIECSLQNAAGGAGGAPRHWHNTFVRGRGAQTRIREKGVHGGQNESRGPTTSGLPFEDSAFKGLRRQLHCAHAPRPPQEKKHRKRPHSASAFP